MKRLVSFILAMAMILSIMVIPVAAAETPELRLSVVTFTENAAGSTIDEGPAKTVYKKGDLIALKVELVNDTTERYITNCDFAIAYDSSAMTAYQFNDSDRSPVGPAIIPLNNWLITSYESETGRVKLSAATSGQTFIDVSATKTIAWFLFKVNEEAETGTYKFQFTGDENQLQGRIDAEGTESSPIELAFDQYECEISIEGAAPTLRSVVITPADGDAEAAYGVEKIYTLKALSDKEKDITNCVTWSVALDGDETISGCTLKGNTLTVTDAQVGTYTVTATPKDNLCTGSAKGTFTVAPQRILNLTLKLTGYGKGLDIADAKITGDNVTVGSSTWYEGESEAEASGKFKAATAYKVAVTLTPDANHVFAVGAQAELAGKKASIADNTAVFILDPTEDKDTPTVQPPDNLSATYGQKLSDVSVTGFKATFGSDETEVAGEFHWQDGTQFVGNVGSREHTIVFTPEDTENYATTSAEVSVSVTPANISGAEIGNIDVQEYTGQEITPEPEVKLGGVVLTKDVDYELTYSGNTAITENAKVTVTGKGNYTGSCEKTFRIVKSLSSEDVTIEVPDEAFVYSGSEFEPKVTVKDGDTLLVKDTDYVVSYSDNTNAGTAAVKVKGIGSYIGEKTVNFTIAPQPVTNAAITITDEGNLVYTGEEIRPSVTVTDYPADSYTVSYANNKNAGTATATVTFKGNYTGSVNKTFEIKKATFTGLAETKTMNVRYGVTTAQTFSDWGLPADVEFTAVLGATTDNDNIILGAPTINGTTLTFSLNTTTTDNIGNTATVPVTFSSQNYQDVTITLTIYIVNKDDAGLQVIGLEDLTMTYGDTNAWHYSVGTGVSGGEAVAASSAPNVITTDNDKHTITAVGVGEATITVTYDSADYYAQKTFTVTVDKKPVTVTADDKTMVYGDELPKELNYTVTEGALVGSDTLTIGRKTTATSTSNVGDYTITLTAEENKNPNYAVTTISGTLTITPAPLTIKSATVQGKTYDGTKNAVVTEVEFNGLKNNETLTSLDYTAAGEFKDANAGAEKEVSVTVTLSTTGTAANYELKSNTFTAKAAIAKRVTELTLSAENAVYTGKPYAQSNITVGSTAATFKFFTNVDNVAVAEITRPTDVGTYWVKATVEESQNEAKSEKSAQFSITPKSLIEEDVTVEPIPAQTYTGEEITPAVTIKYNGMTLEAGKDYTVSYAGNISVGETASVTINGQGNYSGELTKNFTITAKPVTGATVTFSDETLTYNGVAQHPEKITVKVGNVTLEAGKDYTASYPTEANAGEHTATVTFKGNYSGSVTAKYTIEKRTAALSWSPADESFLYTGSACEVTASVSNKVETDEVNVTVVGGRQTAIGSYTATATALDNPNYQLPATDLTHSFTIKNAIESISAAAGSGQSKTVTATVDGLTIKLTGTMKDTDSLALTINGANYTVTDAYVVNVRVGEKQITYTLDKTDLTKTPANVDLTETAPAVETASTDPDTVNAAEEISKNGGAQSEGLAAAAAEAVTNEAASKADGEEKITAETKLEIQVVSYEKNTADNKSVLTLEITPKVTYKDAENTEIETKEIPNSAIKAPITISITLPAGMPTTDLFVKHELENGGVEYLKVTVDEETRVATWQQSSFSPVVLMADNRTVTIKLVKDDKSVIDMKLDLSSVGTALPKDGSKSKWTFDGITGSYDTITKELFDELAKKGTTVTAASVSGSSSDPDSKPGSSSASLLVPGLGDDDLIFRDVSKYDYYYNAVKWAVKKGVTSGTGRYTFSPDAACTRAQTVTFLWRAAGCPKADTKANPFTDVADSDYFYEAVLWAVENGITNGTSKTTFSPNASVTRAQVAAFLWRANGEPAASDSGFTDVASNAYYAKAVAWAYAEGITTGTGFGVFSPEAVCTRAQIVTFLFRNAK